jgi:hypothetical protein
MIYSLSVILLITQSCDRKPEEPELEPEKMAEIRHNIMAWMECEECEDGELEALVEQGELVVPSLIAILDGGPSPANRELLRKNLENNYSKLLEYSETHPESEITMEKGEFVDTYVNNYVALYKTRSAIALGEIGGKESKEALERVLKTPVRDDVRSVIEESINKIR